MEPASSSGLPDVRLFVYGLLLQGEREHGLLEGAPLLGEARTLPQHTLVDLDFYPVLLVGGNVSIVGELYQVSRQLRFKLEEDPARPRHFLSEPGVGYRFFAER